MIDTMTTASAVAPTGKARLQKFLPLRDLLVDYPMLFAAYIVATYLRRELPFGRYVGTNYEWHHPAIYLTIAIGLAGAYALRLLSESVPRIRPMGHFLTALLGIGLATASITVWMPRQSGLQKIYFILGALALTVLIIQWPFRSSTVDRPLTMRENVERLWGAKALLIIWVRYNVRSRYTQAVLGVLWIVLLPLSTAFVLSVVFSQVMRIHISGAPFIAFFLSGFVVWGLFNQSISGSIRAMLANMHLMNQIYFPREIIVLAALGEAMVDSFFMFLAMLVVNAVVGVYPSPHFLILIPLIAIEIAFCLGLMLVVSCISVMIRDIPQLVSVILQILFYSSPIIYPVNIVPERFHFLITLNPIAAIIQAFHSVIVYHETPDWWGVLYAAIFAVGFLVFGYRVFKSNEDRFADMI